MIDFHAPIAAAVPPGVLMLAAGTKLGPYEILGPLGAGGMGEVYRARDTRLGRDVAVKVLPQHLSSSPELRARFEREARAISSLNHPHICVLHDVGRQGDTDYLVMEHLEGETLAARLERGALPTAQLLTIAIEIADALERAHRSGIVHRDLKPGNIMLTKGGAKLMDFGLARAAADPPQTNPSALSQTPTVAATVSQPLTGQGTIVGTFQYMAPEQLEGGEADARTDLFAFGAVMYEMATGKKAFAGKSQASLIAAIIHAEPVPIATHAPMTPPALERAVKQCLAKDPDDRWQSAGDLKRELTWIRDAGSQAGVPAPVAARRRGRERMAWIAALAVVVLAAAGVVIGSRFMPAGHPAKLMRFTLGARPGFELNAGAGEPSGVVIAPDGRNLVFVAVDSTGTTSLWLRPLESLEARQLPGTDGASYPFWSPDSRAIGFFTAGKLERIDAEAGRPQVLCNAADGRGATWSRDGTILFSAFSQGPLFRVSASGGEATQVTHLDSTRREIGHRWPRFLPDGRHFLYLSLPARDGQFDTFMGSLDGKPPRLVARGDRAAVFASPGYLLLVRNETLLAEPFDVGSGKARGEAVSIGDIPDAGGNLGEPSVSASDDGVLAFVTIVPQDAGLVWVDRTGKQVATVPMAPGPFFGGLLSPDGHRTMLCRTDPQTGIDLWMVELDRGTITRFTFDPGSEFFCAWSPDGTRLALGSNRNGPYDIYSRPVIGGGEEQLLYHSDQLKKWPCSWSPDGQSIVYVSSDPRTKDDLWVLPLTGDRQPHPFLQTPFSESNGTISPDGRWMAYSSDENGRTEVYLQSFPTPGAKTQISTGGGDNAQWSRDGRELSFLTSDGRLMVSEIQAQPVLHASVPHALFRFPRGVLSWSFTGPRVLLTLQVGNETAASHTIVLNWTAALKGK
jgi:Tol biopolymer transport system component